MTKSMHDVVEELQSELPEIPGLARRINRAVNDIILAEGVQYHTVKLHDGEYSIHRYSTSMFEDNSATYEVVKDGHTWSCTCPDYEKAPFNMCKHRLAVMILEGMQGEAGSVQ
jgi:SWIM zinc finger